MPKKIAKQKNFLFNNTMRTFFIWMIAGLSVCTSMSAQRGGGGGGRNRGGAGESNADRFPAGEMRRQSGSINRDYETVSITDFPEISGVTYKQNMDLFKIVKDEYKNTLMLSDQKQEFQVKIDKAKNQKDIDKNTKEIAKLDEKIKKVNLDADKKIKAILSTDQYNEFIEKKDQIKFSTPPVLRGGGPRPDRPRADN